MANYYIKRSENKLFYWVLKANNGKVILTSSEQYTTKQNCDKSIKSSKINICGKCIIFGNNNYYYFIQIAKNGEKLGKSEIYLSKESAINGVKSVISTILKIKIIDSINL